MKSNLNTDHKTKDNINRRKTRKRKLNSKDSCIEPPAKKIKIETDDYSKQILFDIVEEDPNDPKNIKQAMQGIVLLKINHKVDKNHETKFLEKVKKIFEDAKPLTVSWLEDCLKNKKDVLKISYYNDDDDNDEIFYSNGRKLKETALPKIKKILGTQMFFIKTSGELTVIHVSVDKRVHQNISTNINSIFNTKDIHNQKELDENDRCLVM